MRTFRVQLTAAVLIDRFVTIEVEDGPNAHLLAVAEAHERAKQADCRWTVRGSRMDRFGDLQQVKIEAPDALQGLMVSAAVEEVEGVEVVKTSLKGFERLGFWALDGLTNDETDDAFRDADALAASAKAACGAYESVQVRDTHAGARR